MRKKRPYSELFWPVFFRIRTEYGEIIRISPYLVQMREKMDQNSSEYGHLSPSFFNQILRILLILFKFISFFILGSSLIYFFHLHTAIRPKYIVLFYSHFLLLCARPFDLKLGSSSICFFYLCSTI